MANVDDVAAAIFAKTSEIDTFKLQRACLLLASMVSSLEIETTVY